jgi:hypothetical protein
MKHIRIMIDDRGKVRLWHNVGESVELNLTIKGDERPPIIVPNGIDVAIEYLKVLELTAVPPGPNREDDWVATVQITLDWPEEYR